MAEQRVTLKEIARQLNISVGTVDRAIHGRGRINEKTREKVMLKLDELGYRPNHIASALGKNRETRVAFITPAHNPFWVNMIKGAREACKELIDYGLVVEFFSQNSDFDMTNQVKSMTEIISNKPDGIIIAPLHPFLLSAPINNAVENGIPVITVNRDSNDSRRLCYVGENPLHTGDIIGTMYGKFMPEGGKIAVLVGSTDFSQFHLRKDGFVDALTRKFPRIEISGFYHYADDFHVAYEISKELLLSDSGIKGIFANTSTGTIAIGRAISDTNNIGRVITISYEIGDEILEMLETNALFATVIQSPFSQGYFAVRLMHRFLMEKVAPDREYFYTRSDIVIDRAQYELYTTGIYFSG